MDKKIKLLIVGAGFAGKLIVHEINKREYFEVVCFVDDNEKKQNSSVLNIPIKGKIKDIPSIVKENSIQEIIIAIPSIEGEKLKEVVEICETTNKQLRILPSTYEVIESLKTGEAEVKTLRRIQISDLLRRKPYIIDYHEIINGIKDKRVMITGAGGSIGSELARQLSELEPKELILVDNSENNLFYINEELKNKHKNFILRPLLLDIKDKAHMQRFIGKDNLDIIFHAAAYKHVPLMEDFPEKAVLNNIMGTKNMIELAEVSGCKKFIFISSDKAVNPTSVMGATKRICEMLLQTKNNSNTLFLSVRFGNVLGSEGSVVPIFERQIREGGPVTITHPDMIRYFMTIQEAVQLVIQASVFGKKNEIFVLDMGKPVKIMDLAKNMIKLSGLKVDRDIKIETIGMRKGEKLYEELLTKKEEVNSTKNKRIFIVNDSASIEITPNIEEESNKLIELSTKGKNPEIIDTLKRILKNFSHN